MEEGILSPEDIKHFRSATGSLLYLSRGTRPDITHSVAVLAKGVVDVKYVETDLQRADILTKCLGAVKFLKNRLLLLGV